MRLSPVRLAAAAAASAAVLSIYLAIIRPRQLRWGATDWEVQRQMPGDDIVSRPTFRATRAVTVAAGPQHIWPWLLQMGLGRAGWYTYDWIDNLGRPSAERVIPELQDVQRGDIVPISPDGKHGLWVKDFETERWLLWWDKEDGATWCWDLYPEEDGRRTRLVSRVHVRYRWLSPRILFHLALDVGDIIMMRKCMLGIKRRAEALAEGTER